MASKREGTMLARPVNWNIANKWEYYIAQSKYNGFHCNIRAVEGVVTLYSSYNNEFVSVPHINAIFEDKIRLGELLHTFERDGELYHHGMPLNILKMLVGRKNSLHPDYRIIQFHMFDVVDDRIQKYRIQQHKDEFAIYDDTSIIRCIDHEELYTMEDLGEFLNKSMRDAYEGLIIRNPNGFYERKKSSYIFKYKPRETDEYQIIGTTEERDYKTKEPKNRLGAFICIKDGQTFKVGTGPALKQMDRDMYWKDREKFESGQYWAVIVYPELSGARGVPFQPVIKKVVMK